MKKPHSCAVPFRPLPHAAVVSVHPHTSHTPPDDGPISAVNSHARFLKVKRRKICYYIYLAIYLDMLVLL